MYGDTTHINHLAQTTNIILRNKPRFTHVSCLINKPASTALTALPEVAVTTECPLAREMSSWSNSLRSWTK